MLEVAHDSYGALKLTEAAKPILRGERRLEFRRDQPAGPKRRRERGGETGPGRAALEGDAAADALFEALRAARSRLARAQGVPPYVIFHDTTLIALASRRPQSLTALEEIPGMGERKDRALWQRDAGDSHEMRATGFPKNENLSVAIRRVVDVRSGCPQIGIW